MLASFLVLGLALAVGFGWYERSHPSARVLALVATLAALAALGRIAFAPLPSVKPTTDIVLLTGYALGGAPGFAVGAAAALASNLFFGQGPWTPWQMAGWGGAGLFGAALAQLAGRELGRLSLAAACAAAGLAFGAVMNLSLWVTYSGDHTLAKLGAVFATSLPFDVAHALGNAAFCLAFGPALVRALRRFRTRFDVTWRPAPAAAGVAVALLALVVALPAAARAAVAARSIAYLERAQNSDGGLGPAPGAGSTQMHTGWAALGLAASGRNPRDVERSGRDMVDYIRGHAAALRGDLGERSRTILALRAAGVSATRAGGRDLLGELLRAQEDDGSFAGRVNTTAFAILALRAAGRTASDRAVRAGAAFIASQANDDGGFNFAGRGGPSGADDTGAALQALAAAGRCRSAVVRRAADWLESRQNADGGFALQSGQSNAQSTAWAIQGLIAAGRRPAQVRRDGSRSPLGYLRSLVTAGGAIRYSRTSAQTPVWVTAQALTALARKPFPLRPAPRAPRRSTAAAPAPTATPQPAATPVPRKPAARRPAQEPPAIERTAGIVEAPPEATAAILLTGLLAPGKAAGAGFVAGVIARAWLPRGPAT
ncbi:MAG TPA: prenyltransferase/squalene oxidase repeat-containing protein [Solirubrobacteraceae bacterium]|nr:prenyltransferase/squalene oxidase repeat-containing protein [Solirubrobacteraceae bacterium]